MTRRETLIAYIAIRAKSHSADERPLAMLAPRGRHDVMAGHTLPSQSTSFCETATLDEIVDVEGRRKTDGSAVSVPFEPAFGSKKLAINSVPSILRSIRRWIFGIPRKCVAELEAGIWNLEWGEWREGEFEVGRAGKTAVATLAVVALGSASDGWRQPSRWLANHSRMPPSPMPVEIHRRNLGASQFTRTQSALPLPL